ncbi:hypothetical protein B6I21_03675 [candidate division KSB1 bacterium 4572_119]|nr:MAG: hypothetical protein B6I21_03675 [candidate division KSB1 bacterium 4572_119]
MIKKFAPDVIFVLCVLILLPNLIFGAIIKHTYHFDMPTVKKQQDGTDLVYFQGSYQMGNVGSPSVPMQKIAILLPPGHIATDITITPRNLTSLNQKIHLSRRQNPRMSMQTSDKNEHNHSNYHHITSTPSLKVEYQTHYLFGHAIALATFSPVDYNPESGSFSYYTDVDVFVQHESDITSLQALKNYRYSEIIRQQLAGFVHNFEETISDYPEQIIESQYDYLIITIQDFVDDYQQLSRFHNERGMKTRIVAVEDIYNTSSGNDEEEKIRNFIINEFQENGISYVLLAGDADSHASGENQIPIRYLWAEVLSGGSNYTDFIPSDLYYSSLDGNWNADGDEKYGEPGEDDLLPEINVARITADNSQEIQSILNKILNYQSQPVMQDATKMLMAGQYLWDDPLSFGSDYIDLLIGTRTDNGYSTAGIDSELDFTYLYDRDLYPGHWDTQDLLQVINSGTNFVHHLGHSSNRSNMSLTLDEITNDNFYLTDGITHLNPIIYSEGCSAAKLDVVNYDGSDCIAEQMLEIDNFASAFIGNTRYGWFNEGQTEGPSLHLHREFVSALYGKEILTISEAHRESRIQSAPFVTAQGQWEPGALRWTFYGCNVFGDAAMAPWTNQIYEFDEIVYQSPNPDEFKVETNVAGARVTLSLNSEIIATLLSDCFGTAFFSFDSTLDYSEVKLTVTARNFKPFTEQINLSPNPSTVTDKFAANNLKFNLRPAYPNPFNPVTTIEFSITKLENVRLEVYNVRGQRVRTLLNEDLAPGNYRNSWDGKNDLGLILANGVYLFRLSTPEGIKIKSCVFLK